MVSPHSRLGHSDEAWAMWLTSSKAGECTGWPCIEPRPSCAVNALGPALRLDDNCEHPIHSKRNPGKMNIGAAITTHM